LLKKAVFWLSGGGSAQDAEEAIAGAKELVSGAAGFFEKVEWSGASPSRPSGRTTDRPG